MGSVIDYTNLVNFAKFANGINKDKYNNMYALRGYDNSLNSYIGDESNKYIEEPNDNNADKVTRKDFDALLMILSGAIDNNTYNFGGDCGIVGAPICSFENPDANTIADKKPRHKIEITNKNFSKCIYGSESLNINQNTSSILNGNTLIVKPDEEDECHINNIANHMCPDDTHFYWDTTKANWGLAGNLFNYFTDEKAKHGQCVKRYGANPDAKIDKNSIVENDPYKISDDGKCMSRNTVMKDNNGGDLRTPLPNESTGICDEAGCEINNASSNELARECANADKIYYDGGEYIIPNGVLTQDCKIFTTTPTLTPNDILLTQKASRQDIEDREEQCQNSQTPYYNSKLDHNNIRKKSYDIPSNIIDSNENADTWWDNNTCRYVYEIPLKTETGQTYGNNEIWHPPLFNGQCSISNLGSNYTLGSGSESNSSDSNNYESIGLFVEEDALKSIKDSQNTPSPMEHPFYTSIIPYEKEVTNNVYSGASRNGESLNTKVNTKDENIAEIKCVWLDSGSGTYNIDGNETLSAIPNKISENSTGQFFKYVKNVDTNQYTKEPNYYTNSAGINKMIPHNKWRQVDVCDSEDEDKVYGYEKQTPGVLEFDETGGKWYNDDNFENLDTIYENNSNKLYKLKVNANDIQSNSAGSGSGKCLRKITINKLPQYVRDSDDDTLKFNDTGNTANKVNETHLENQFGVGSDSVYEIYNEIYKANLEEGNSLYYTIENKLCGVGADPTNPFTNALNHMSKFNEQHEYDNIQDAYVQLQHAWIKESPSTT